MDAGSNTGLVTPSSSVSATGINPRTLERFEAEPPRTMPRVQHRIAVRNHSGSPCAYHLLADALDVTGCPGSSESDSLNMQNWRLVYQSSLVIPHPHGSAHFSVMDTTLAICGSGKTTCAPGLVLYSSDWQEAAPATGDAHGSHLVMTMPEGHDASFDIKRSSHDAFDVKGAFGITVNTSFRYPHPKFPFVGLGAPDPYNVNNVIPIAIFEAQPGCTYSIRPNSRYLIAAGTADPGQIVAIDPSTKLYILDFSDPSVLSAEVIHNENGTFSIDYIYDETTKLKALTLEASTQHLAAADFVSQNGFPHVFEV